MGYRCSACKKIVDMDELRLRCQCGNPILIKERPTVIKRVKAE
ncbi:MAG: Rpo12/RPC10 RNA polymerase subunit family protein [Methermicoccaceae archaeon]